jgi:hypothetical protein
VGAAALATLALCLAAPAAGAGRPWFLPDQARLQFAGHVGLLAPGVGWEFARERLEADLLYGFVPASVAGEDLHALTLKVGWRPLALSPRPRWRLRPLTSAVQLTYTLDRDHFVRQPGRYPRSYYDVPTAVRAGVAVGASLGRERRGGGEVAVYAELVALDVMLVAWARNPRTIGPRDVFSLALGLRADLE